MRQFENAVTGGLEHVGMRAYALHKTGNGFILADCSNAFNGQ